ncbi:hypothetical protein ACIBCH_16960 [Amycolatopsis thailandensis]
MLRVRGGRPAPANRPEQPADRLPLSTRSAGAGFPASGGARPPGATRLGP